MRRFLRKPWLAGLALAVVVVVTTALLFSPSGASAPAASTIAARVKKGDFKVVVQTAGELRAIRDIKITGPMTLQQAQVFNVKIATLIPEGTVVKEGDMVAELDKTPAATKMADVTLALQKAQAVFEQAQLDSTLNLSKAREEMKTMELSLQEKQIAKDQAKYEAPSVQRQVEIDLEKAQRALAQAKLDYKTKTEQAQAKMREVGADLQRQRNLLTIIQEVMANFTVRAPAPGMVIYIKEWNGKKRTAGSQIGAWDPTVATLPDLSGMESVTYVNEIDVRKVEKGQPVTITLDADPSKTLTGKVTAVANVGEQRPNADAKVFEVKVLLDRPDTTLRPGMTTGNAIETASVKNVLFVPIEAVNSDSGFPYVFKRAGGRIIKQEIETGAMNDDEVVVGRGLEDGDEVMLLPPPNKDDLALARLPGSRDKPKAAPLGDTALKNEVKGQRSEVKATATQPKRG
ncbi:MAG TPA: efflux RND transporter periplasmic adaptor subunit [Gemmatimonadaceae bacterium]|nr:efflux RND transporter periplasmic adaptor subunit [Gemmatimonadaceae bacterium]